MVGVTVRLADGSMLGLRDADGAAVDGMPSVGVAVPGRGAVVGPAVAVFVVAGRGAAVGRAAGAVVLFVGAGAATAGAVEGGSCCDCRWSCRFASDRANAGVGRGGGAGALEDADNARRSTAVAFDALRVTKMMRLSAQAGFLSNCASAVVERRSSDAAQTKRSRCTVPTPS
jgi:hypothetical protein